jgi:hypothetical protein
VGELGAVIGRRDFLATVGVGFLVEQLLGDDRRIAGTIVGASHAAGHRLREAPLLSDGPTERVEVVIAGSGASGASAAWRLAAAGIRATMLELEPRPGGTSAWGDDGVVPHPWGAHYLPVPEPGARATSRLLEELGVLTGWDAAGRPRFREEMFVHTPEERLFRDGKWLTGLVPDEALTREEREELARFRETMADLRAAVGSDGRAVFALPVGESSRDPRFLALDRITMARWLEEQGYRTPLLRWLAAYSTLDDFGADPIDCSAWAGLHYHASRKLETDQTQGSRYLVWPEGNGWLLRRLLLRAAPDLRLGCLVISAESLPKGGVVVTYLDLVQNRVRRLEARAAVLALPGFVLQRVVPGAPVVARPSSPWLVANLHVRRPVDPNHAWDSVIYDGLGLGYVDAGHQRTSLSERTVLTYFRAFGDPDPAGVRRALLGRGWSELASEVLADLAVAHPELPSQTERLDVMIWGHAMPRPRPGFLGRRPFEAPISLGRGLSWAHVDQSGIALFEEANLRGVQAAEQVLADLGHPAETWT